MVPGNRMHRPSLQGSVFWMAPEVVKQSGHTPKADIWSVGCLVVEMLTGEHPWSALTPMQALFEVNPPPSSTCTLTTHLFRLDPPPSPSPRFPQTFPAGGKPSCSSPLCWTTSSDPQL